MKFKTYAREFMLAFAITFIVSIIVTFLYSLIVHGQGAVNWEITFDLAILVGILIPVIEHRGKKNSRGSTT
jgi:hypothetical protein